MGNVAYPQTDEIAASKLAVDGQVEHREVADGMQLKGGLPHNCGPILSDWPMAGLAEQRKLPSLITLPPSHDDSGYNLPQRCCSFAAMGAANSGYLR